MGAIQSLLLTGALSVFDRIKRNKIESRVLKSSVPNIDDLHSLVYYYLIEGKYHELLNVSPKIFLYAPSPIVESACYSLSKLKRSIELNGVSFIYSPEIVSLKEDLIKTIIAARNSQTLPHGIILDIIYAVHQNYKYIIKITNDKEAIKSYIELGFNI